jgi:hypothetical protein
MMLTLPMHSVGTLREQGAQQAFLARFGNERPQVTGEAIDRAFRQGMRDFAPLDHIELLEKGMEELLGIVSDEEEE